MNSSSSACLTSGLGSIQPASPGFARQGSYPIYFRLLIFRRLLYVIDHKSLYWPLLGFQFEAQLLLNRPEDRRSSRISWGEVRHCVAVDLLQRLALRWYPLQLKVTDSCESGLIQNALLQLFRQHLCQRRHGNATIPWPIKLASSSCAICQTYGARSKSSECCLTLFDRSQ